MKDNWPSFGQIESIDQLSETELRCTLCLLDVVLAALAKDECFCPNREIIRLVLTRTLSLIHILDQQRFGIRLSYQFNATKSKYKGTGAGASEKSRL